MAVTHVMPPPGVRLRVPAFQVRVGDLVPFAADSDNCEWLTVVSVESGREVRVDFDNGVSSTSSSHSVFDIVRP